MKKEALERYKTLLLRERKHILNSKANVGLYENIDIGEAEAGDIVDMASKLYETEFFLQLADHEQETLKLIDKALQKIEDGKYGICEATGRKIEEARLEAIPWTPYCIEYAKKISRKK